MRTLLKIAGAVLICVVLLLLTLRITGLEPHNFRPGLWLKGDPVTTPVSDWSYTDKLPTVKIETRTWYLIPHSVTTACSSYNGQLYVGSTLDPGRRYPHHWNENVARDPHVRVKVGSQLFAATLSLVTDPAEKAAVLHLRAKKYHRQDFPDLTVWWVYRVTPG